MHLENENKSRFILLFARFSLSLQSRMAEAVWQDIVENEALCFDLVETQSALLLCAYVKVSRDGTERTITK